MENKKSSLESFNKEKISISQQKTVRGGDEPAAIDPPIRSGSGGGNQG